MRTLADNGGWCWFSAPRAIVDPAGMVLFGSVKSPHGDIDINKWDPASGAIHSFVLAERFQSDDHDHPSVLRLSDGRILAAWTGHSGLPLPANNCMHWRVSERPDDISSWRPTKMLDVGAAATYSNLMPLSSIGCIYNFYRGLSANPHWMISGDGGESFELGGRLIRWPRPDRAVDPRATPITTGRGRPYVRYCGNGVDEIHFVCTEDHPRNYDNSVYHGRIRVIGARAVVCRSDGQELGELHGNLDGFPPTAFTKIFDGNSGHVAWVVDLQLDQANRPRVIFSTRTGDAARRHRDDPEAGQTLQFHFAELDPTQWRTLPLAHAGSCLYRSELDYSGLAALDPFSPAVAYISTNSDPQTGHPLISSVTGRRHWELFRGKRHADAWSWTPMTQNSDADNIRPVCAPLPNRRTAVLWMRGEYRSYEDYRTQIVAKTHDA